MRMRHPDRPIRHEQHSPKITEKHVIKSGPAAEMDLEHFKTNIALTLHDQIPYLRVPKVISFDTEHSTMVLERIKDVVPFWSLLLDSNDPSYYLYLLGEIIALIHINYVVPETSCKHNSKSWSMNESEIVSLHGDLWLCNILYCTDSEEIVIVDWSTSPWMPKDMTIGSRYIDVGTTCLSLFTPPKGALLSRQYKPDIYVRAFLEGYQKRSMIDAYELIEYTQLAINELVNMYSASLGEGIFHMRKYYSKYCHARALKYFEQCISH